MYTRQLATTLALIGWLGASLTGFAEPLPSDGWVKIAADDGITVYTKDQAGSDTLSLRGEAIIAATVSDIRSVMIDNSIAHEWVPMCQERRQLELVSAHERIELTRIKMPWPLTDRYFVNRGRAEELEGGVLRLSIASIEMPERYFKDESQVLGHLYFSEFLLKPMDGGARTLVTLEVNSDPKGLIPKWLVNMVQQSWPRKFLTGLAEQLAKQGKLANGASFVH